MALISFVIPCYRSQDTIGSVVSDIETLMSMHKEDSYEIVLVNDCSPDYTWDSIVEIHTNHPNIKALSFAKNFGQHAALMAGFSQVEGDIVVCLDDDGQTPASEAYKLIDKLAEGYDVIYAEYPEKKHSAFRNIGSIINKKMTEMLLDKPKGLYQSSYFAAKRFVVDEMLKYQNPYPYAMGLVLRTTMNVANVPIEHHDRLVGNSGYTFKKLAHLLVNGFTAFSVKPLRMATVMGMVVSLLGFVYAVYAIINKIVNPEAPLGWTSLVIIVLLVGGMILFVLGLIGEYIGRIYISINNSPQYVVREVLSSEKRK